MSLLLEHSLVHHCLFSFRLFASQGPAFCRNSGKCRLAVKSGRQRVSSQILGSDFDGFNSAVALVDARTLLHVQVLWMRYMGSVASALIARTLTMSAANYPSCTLVGIPMLQHLFKA